MPAASEAGKAEERLQLKQKMAWNYLEERAAAISAGKVQPDGQNEMDALAIQLAKTLPGLYKKMDEEIEVSDLHTCVTRQQEDNPRFLPRRENDENEDLEKTPASLYQESFRHGRAPSVASGSAVSSRSSHASGTSV